MRRLLIFATLLVALFIPIIAFAQEGAQTLTFRGYLDATVPFKDYPITLNAGQSVLITAEAQSGNLDTLVELYDPNGRIVASNDDRNGETLDSALGYTAVNGGTYTVRMTRYQGAESSGHYLLTIVIGDSSVLEPLDSLTRLQLSGPTLTRDTTHFRIHYTLEGEDAVDPVYLEAVVLTAEEVWGVQIDQMGWAPPPQDGVLGGDHRYDVYLVDIIGRGESALGYASPQSIVGDNPYTEAIETAAGTSYLAIENDFRDVDGGTPISLMRATFAHEFNHAIQFGYDVNDAHNWIYEATASWIETAVFVKDEDATGYVEYAYQYPELCFGTTSDPGDGQLQYGEWTFLQHLVDVFGPRAPIALWENIAKYEGFEALEVTLHDFNAELTYTVATYRLKNLAREYALAPEFNATVWLENTITGIGRWSYTGRGIQELGANYFAIDLPAGTYYAGLVNDGGVLDLWAIGVTDNKLEIFPLGRGGNFDTTSYRYVYLMVFNPVYDEDVEDCRYYDYDIDITTGKAPPHAPVGSFDARHFQPLRSSGF